MLCIYIYISSPDEWATTKQACRDELAVYLFFFSTIYSSLYFYVLSTLLRTSSFTLCRNFSLRQRLHLLLELKLYGECDERMRQEIKCSMLLSLRVQICLLSSVEFLCLAWRNDAVWLLYLVLKSFSVSPMYVSVVLLSLRVTVAW